MCPCKSEAYLKCKCFLVTSCRYSRTNKKLLRQTTLSFSRTSRGLPSCMSHRTAAKLDEAQKSIRCRSRLFRSCKREGRDRSMPFSHVLASVGAGFGLPCVVSCGTASAAATTYGLGSLRLLCKKLVHPIAIALVFDHPYGKPICNHVDVSIEILFQTESTAGHKSDPVFGHSQVSSKVSSKVAPAGSPPGRSSSKSSPPGQSTEVSVEVSQ